VVEHLLSKPKALRSNSSQYQKKKKKKRQYLNDLEKNHITSLYWKDPRFRFSVDTLNNIFPVTFLNALQGKSGGTFSFHISVIPSKTKKLMEK
jgi:hypothetical protein